jgi:nitroreductase
MPARNQAALDFLLSRKSYPAKMLTAPYPGRDEITEMLTAAARTPDHGKLEPWRFVVLNGAALDRLADAMEIRGPEMGEDPEKVAKSVATYRGAGCAVVVVSSPVALDKIPTSEQIYSAGGACLALVNAATAAGWGASWISGWFSHDRAFIETNLGLEPHETVAGIIHLGMMKSDAPDRPRPDLSKKVQWIEA